MTPDEFIEYVKTGGPLDTPAIHLFMDEMSCEARRITFELNAAYHTPEEVRALLSGLFGQEVDPTLRVFPPFYTDFGKISASVKEYLSMPAAIFRIMAVSLLAMIARSDIMSFLPRSTMAFPLPPAKRPIPPRSYSGRTFGLVRTLQFCRV